MAPLKGRRGPGHFPKRPLKLYLGEYMELRGLKAKQLADAMDVSEAAVSRWIDGLRQPRPILRQKIEEFLGLRPGGLHLPPTSAPDESLIAGLNEADRVSALNYIRFLYTRKQ